MATTRLIPLHAAKGKSVAECFHDRLGYAQNPEKTEAGKLVTGYACNPKTAEMEFLLARNAYQQQSLDRHNGREIIAYQIRQSFKPGEIMPEEANAIGYELGMSI